MNYLTKNDLLTLEEYALQRNDFRKKVIMHKRARQVSLGENLRLYFEDRLTIQYQIQEMLHIEKIFESEGIEEELSAYNPLIPDGNNWKATMMLEFEDVEQRKKALSILTGIEDSIWVKIGDNDKVYAIADEDIDRDTPEKTSSVHFLRFQLARKMIADACLNQIITLGVDHPHYTYDTQLNDLSRVALITDLSFNNS